MNETRENLIKAISTLSDHFFRYLQIRSDADEPEKDDFVCHIARMVIVSLVTCANHKLVFDLDYIKDKLIKCTNSLNSDDGRQELLRMWIETHGRLVSYRDLRGG